MKIALFPSNFHPHFGGVEELVRQLAHQLKRDGHAPTVFTNRWPKDLPANEEFEGLNIHRHVFRVPERTWRQFGGAVLYGPGAQRALHRQLRETDAEVLHIQCVSSNAYYALGAKRALGLPLVVTLHGELTMDASRLFERSAFARNLMRRALAEADAITACSKDTLDEAEKFFGEPFGSRGRVIYSGISATEFDVAPYKHVRPYIFAIGRHVAQKGFDVLLRAYASAVKMGTPFDHDLVLAGDGEMRAELERLSVELALEGRVHFIGRTDRAATATLFSGASFFVLPSRHEPMGIVNLEAMAAGKAVIASRVGGVPEIVSNGETGLLVEGGSVEDLTRALTMLVNDEALRNRLGNAGRERSRHFGWNCIAEEYLRIYEQLLVSRGAERMAAQ